jgi:hypothetical protein
MTRLEAILNDARGLSADELAKLLAALLLEQSPSSAEGDERLTGERGLAAWTESMRGEDWSEFYPASLRNGGSRTP